MCLTVFVTAIGSLSAEAVINGLSKNGYRVVGGDIHPACWIANSLIVDKFYQMPLATETESYIACLEQICKENEIGYIFPLTDVEVDVLNENRGRFEQNAICVCLAPTKTVKICRNKFLLYKTLERYSVPKLIPTLQAIETLLGEMKFPLICKPNNGRSSEGIYHIQDGQEWDYFKKHERIENYIVQPEIVGNIVTVDIVRNADTGECVSISRKEVIRTGNGAGISVYLFEDSQLKDRSRCIAEALNIHGCVNFEFIACGEDYFFMECNPRFSGGVVFSVLAGYDCITNHMRCFRGEHIDQDVSVKNRHIARKYTEYIMEGDSDIWH